MPAQNLERKKVLLVCSRGCGRVEEVLRHAGYWITKVADGTAAIERAKHEPLNAAVLISTSGKMDLAETALNLKDINPAVEIVIVSGSDQAEEKSAQMAAIVRALPETSVTTVNEFGHYLDSVGWKGRHDH